jgi:hypothetical protein
VSVVRNIKTGAVAVLVSAVVLAGCGWVAKSVPVLNVQASADGLTLEVTVATCNAELSIDIKEDYQSVTLFVTARQGSDADCADGITAELENPLSGRKVIDGHDFTEIAATTVSE